MPNRIIKDSIHESEKVNAMTDFQFRLWVSLITYVDDYGRGDARPAIIKGNCFPLRDRLTNKDIDAALTGLAGIGCIVLYEVDGRPYLCFPNWEKHQTVRNKRSRFPEPPGELLTSAINCNQLNANASLIQSNPIQSEYKSESESESNARGAFDVFWSAYPKKVGKEAARKAFAKVGVSVDVLVNAVEQQKLSAQWQRDNGQYIPNPATWLNQGRWEDELTTSPTQVSLNYGDRSANIERMRKMLEDAE